MISSTCKISQLSTDKTIPLSNACQPELPSELNLHESIVKERKNHAHKRIREILRKKNQTVKTKKTISKKSSNKTILGPFKQSPAQLFKCQICLRQRKETPDLYVTDCQHKGLYCQQCLHQYTIHRVKQFQEVTCPDLACDIPLQTEGAFFSQLPLDIQQRYKKIRQFLLTQQDPNARMCPLQNCEGVIRKQVLDAPIMVCDTCQSRVCSNCLLKQHDGQCDQYELTFMEQNLNYRKCRQCGIIIQKNQGCNHMTCRCSHEFCYVCGQNWDNSHHSPHDQNGNVIISETMKVVLPEKDLSATTSTDKEKVPKEKKEKKGCLMEIGLFLLVILKNILRGILFFPKVGAISVLGVVLIVYMFLMIIFGVASCCCILAFKKCEDVFSKIEQGGACMANVIKKIWQF